MSQASKPSNVYRRSYLFKVDERCNAAKLAALQAMQAEWQRMLPVVGAHLWGAFLRGEPRGKSLSSAVGEASVFAGCGLVTSVRQCLAVAVEGSIASWQSNLKRRIARLVMRSERYARDEPFRHELLWLNRMGLWLVPLERQRALLADAGAKVKLASVSARASRLMARYVRAYLWRYRAPNFERLPMQVNQLSSVLARQHGARLDGVSHWLRMSTLERGVRIELPLRANAYAEQFEAPHALTFSLFERHGAWYIKVVKVFERPALRAGRTVGVDVGMRTLLATSDGALFFQGFNERLRRWDERFQALTRGLQGAGELRLRQCRRYRDFVSRFRGWLRSQVRQAVNRFLASAQPATVVIEALGFHAERGTLSARMNRLVRRMGTGLFKEAMAQKAEKEGFVLVEVNPAYTSQECGSCGFIHRMNRSGDRFRCVGCGRRSHADANAARNLVERFRQGRTGEYLRHTALGAQGLQRWAERLLGRLEQSAPGTWRYQGALGCARAGLRALDKGKGLAQRGPESVQRLRGLLDPKFPGPTVQRC